MDTVQGTPAKINGLYAGLRQSPKISLPSLASVEPFSNMYCMNFHILFQVGIILIHTAMGIH